MACQDTADQMALAMHGATLTGDVKTCTIGHAGNMAAESMCLQMTDGLSKGCADCFAAYGQCGLTDCAASCIADPSGMPCQMCIQTMCGPAFASCSGIMNLNPPGDAGAEGG
jgi:hypothetical protein